MSTNKYFSTNALNIKNKFSFVNSINVMTDTITKPKSWTQEIADLLIGESVLFASEHTASIKTIISGNNRGGLRENYPKRKFKTKTLTKVNEDLIEYKVLQVTRVQ